MIISFDGPVFYAQADEDQFFNWLRSLPEFQEVFGVGTTLHMSLKAPVSPETVRQLLVIFRRWGLSVGPLQPLQSTHTEGFVLWNTDLGAASRAKV